MRIKDNKPIPDQSGLYSSSAEITFTGPLILYANPFGNKEAATKQYADMSVSTGLNADNFSEGVIDVGRLPAFSGDVINATGTNVFTLGNNGVTPGTYVIVDIDDTGRIVSGRGMEEEDIPELPWSKITGGKPNTLEGYGITDSVSLSGGEVGPDFKITAEPTEPLHLANLKYLTEAVEGMESNAIPGTVVIYGTNEQVNGFLRCNGGYVSKTQYTTLYSIIGDRYNHPGVPEGMFALPDYRHESTINAQYLIKY